MNLNKVFLIGRMAADPEFRTTPNGQEVATLRIATNRVFNDRDGKKQEFTEFHTVVTWGKLAQIANQYLKKGALTMIEGRLQTRSWQGQDGVKRYRTEIVAETLQLGPRPSGSVTREPTPEEEAPAKIEEIPVVDEEIAPTADVEETTVNIKEVPF